MKKLGVILISVIVFALASIVPEPISNTVVPKPVVIRNKKRRY